MKKRLSVFIGMLLAASLIVQPLAYAQTPSSSNYSVPESGFSSGSAIDANSANFNARVSAGDLGIGFSESGNYLGYAGPISPDEEFVELLVPDVTIDLGTIEPGVPGTGSVTFSARSYLNDNYIIVSPRQAPSNGSKTIDSITTASAFDSSVEQFGINLVANTAPVAQGANPSRQPVDDGFYAFGEAAPGYAAANLYQYNAGDVIARSVIRGYGETDYTISYLFNVTPVTPAGQYRMEQDLVITATF